MYYIYIYIYIYIYKIVKRKIKTTFFTTLSFKFFRCYPQVKSYAHLISVGFEHSVCLESLITRYISVFYSIHAQLVTFT